MRDLIIVFVLLYAVCGVPVDAKYVEVMSPDDVTKHLALDYGLVDDGAKRNQSVIFQKAIDEMSAAGGGRLLVPKGVYLLAGVCLKSNVHLLFEADTVIKPYWPEGEKAVVFILSSEESMNRKASLEEQKKYIENVSLRGLGGRWIIDYSERERREGEGCRAVLCRMVKNFLIADLDVKDNCTVYCGITLTPTNSRSGDVKSWELSRATDGTVINCRIFNASPGYGLVQLHGAQSVHFEDLYGVGGVTLRLETGSGGERTGVYDISGKNINCENGRCAVMLGPHHAVNGFVHVDGIFAKSCTYAVTIGYAGVKKADLERDPTLVDGKFADGSTLKNIHAVFGMNAQIKGQALLEVPKAYYDDLRLRKFPKFMDGPSIGAVKDTTGGGYEVIVENVTMEGFEYNNETKVLKAEHFRKGNVWDELKKWKQARGIPIK